ncbi:MAG: hypothetical protein U0361_21640 [Nitrospiraceae bacterium]
MGELLRELNQSGTDAAESPVSPERLIGLLRLVDQGTISLKVARYLPGGLPEREVAGGDREGRAGLTQVSDEGALQTIIAEVLACEESVAGGAI